MYAFVGLVLILMALGSVVVVLYVVLNEEHQDATGSGYARSPFANEPAQPAAHESTQVTEESAEDAPAEQQSEA